MLLCRVYPFLSLMFLSLSICAGCDSARAGETQFKTARIERGAIEHRVIATGRIEPLSKVEIRSKVDGIIKTIVVEEGDPVRKGQVIIELDRDILKSRVAEARAALERARARHRQASVEEQAAVLEMDSAHKKFERAEKLFAQGLSTQQSMEDAETALLLAQHNYRGRQAAVSIATAEVAAMAASLERTENELSYAAIFSPLDGIVLSRYVDMGSTVASVVSTLGTLLMTLGDIREMHMVGDVDESDIGLVQEGMPTRISVESYRDRKFNGTVKRISPLGVEKDKIMNFEVEVAIESNEAALRTNMTADAEIIVAKKEHALLVPQNAIKYERNQSYVEVPDSKEESGKRRVNVAFGISGIHYAELLEGLKEGDEIIVSER